MSYGNYGYSNPWDGETEYPDYGMTYGGYQPPPSPSLQLGQANAATQTPTPPSNLIPGLGLGLGVIGTGLNAYGAYEASKQADKQFDLQEEAYNFDKELTLQDRIKADEERKRRAELEAGDYASRYLQNAQDRYGAYNQMTGR